MADLEKRLKNLSPEQRALLEKKLRENAINKTKADKIPVRKNINEYPMSSAQERLWFLNQLNPDSGFYNIPAAIKMIGKLNIDALNKSLSSLIKRHQILNATFDVENNKPVQKIKNFDFDIEIVEITGNSVDINKIINDEAQKSFSIKDGPLYRIKLLRISNIEHILLLTLHHIVADGWSVGILINELSQNYDAFSKNNESPFNDLPIQYFDYAEWRNNFYKSENEERELKFWEEKLSGMPQTLELPYDRVRPASQTFKGDKHYFNISAKLTDSIKQIGHPRGASPFITFLSILQILFYKYSNQNDFGIGTLVSDRQRSETKDLIGFFVNTMVMRSEIDGNQNFYELLNKVKEYSLDAFQHQYLPFEKVVEKLLEERSSSISPLFQVMFDFQETPFKKLNLPEITLEVIEQEMQIAKFELLLILEDNHDGITGAFEFNTDIFDKETIKRFADSYIVLLESIVNNADQPINKLSIISNIEEINLLKNINSISNGVPNIDFNLSVHKIISKVANQNWDTIALVFGDEKVSYGNFESITNKLSHYLVNKGINLDELVGVCLDRSFEMMFGLVGILKAGGAYLPIDPNNPKERINFIVKDSKTKYLITTSKQVPKLKEIEVELIILDELENILANESDQKLNIKIDDQNIMYCIYTSGSTGNPKGTLVPHKGVINRLLWMRNEYDISVDDNLLQKTPYTFDVSVWELFLGLISGATTVIAKPEGHRDGKYLKEIIQKHLITIIHFVPSMLRGFLEEEKLQTYCASLKNIICSGEALSYELQNKLFNEIPKTKLNNLYGPTEASIDVSYWVCNNKSENEIVPIGKHIWNTQLYVLNSGMYIVPIGVIGELYIGGVSLARGYLNRADLTANMFVPNPFDNIGGSRLYRTGDLVRYLKDGTLQYLGRRDNQVKIRGLRIELGEIEERLKEYNSIANAIVLLYGDIDINKKLIAFYILKTNSNINLANLKKEISKKLPDYMIPASFIEIDKIPITDNGKLNRKALLSRVVESENEKSENYVAPRNELEKYLVKTLEEILDKKNIGIHDNFFNLGGNSIQAAVLANNLQKEFEESFHVGSIFFAPTIQDITKHLVEYFPEKIETKFGKEVIHFYDLESNENISEDSIDEDKIKKFSKLLPPLTSRKDSDKSFKNKKAVFILSAPRSGSTLLRVMLNSNNKIFAPPELELMSFSSMQERNKAFKDEHLALKDGLTRALMEMKNCTREESEELVNQFEQNDFSVKEVYREIQNLLDNQILIDKTPIYSLNQEILDRIEEDFEDAQYIHIIRNPYAVIHSFKEAKMDTYAFRQKMPFDIEELGELIWYKSNENINNFLKNVPENRKFELKFSELVFNPEEEMRRISNFLDIDYKQDMINPYANKNMTDGISENVPMVGDVKYYMHKKINAKVVDKWKESHKRYYLGEPSKILAKKYSLDIEIIGDSKVKNAIQLTDKKIKEFENIIVPLKNWKNKITTNIPKTIFILSPPRSGSTLLRVMLEGHPKLFSPPELDLLTFNTLGERKEKLKDNLSLWLEATIRAIMELKNCSSEEAEKIMTDLEQKDIHVSEFYALLRKWSKEKILVDKTPTYSLDMNTLEKANQYFENPLFVHLVRNPYASIYSAEKASLRDTFFRYDNDFKERELAELIWMKSHENIIKFLETIPEERKIKLKFEDLVSSPKTEMHRLSSFIGIDFDEKLLNPYEGNRMTDPIKENSQMVGDFKFYLRDKIDPQVNLRWKKQHKNDFLCPRSEEIAVQLGCKEDEFKIFPKKSLQKSYSKIEKISRDQNLPLSFAQQRLWFLDQLDPGKATYNIPGVVKVKGKLSKDILEKSINEIIRRHESLRTLFVSKDGKSSIQIISNLKIEIKIFDLSNSDVRKKENESNELILNLSKQPFSLSEGPLIRADMIKLNEGDFILVISMHHIISDGWSSEIFVRELAILYKAFNSGNESPLPDLNIGYADFAFWQKEWMKGIHYKTQISYWKSKLDNLPPLLELPTDFTRPAIQSQKGKRIQFELDKDLIHDISKLCVSENVTLYILLFTAFNILLNKVTNSEDIAVGTPVAGRNRNEIEPIIGFFVNTLVIRNDLSKNPTINQLLQSVKKEFLEALNHQEIPFEKLVDELNIERSLSHSPLFQIMFVLNESPLSKIEMEDISLQPLSLDLGSSKFDMTFVLTKRNDRIRGSLEYDTSLFSEDSITKFIDYYKTILENTVEKPKKRLSDINIVPEREIDLLNNDWNSTDASLDLDITLHQIFENQVRSLGDKTALVLSGKYLSYEELNIWANQIAGWLIENGVKKEDVIGIYMDSSIEAIISILGVLKAGCGYLALDPSYPLQRLDFMLNASDVKYLLYNDNVNIDLLNSSTPSINVGHSEIVRSQFKDNPNQIVTGKNLAYIVYTSGSTGQPKGVALTHKGVLNHINDFHSRKPLSNGTRSSLWTSLNFDVSVYEIFYPLLHGGELHIVPEDIRLLDSELFDWLAEKEIENGYLPPFKLGEFSEWLTLNSKKCRLTKLLSGVESIKLETFAKIQKSLPELLILNGYGPAETTICSTVFEYNPNILNEENAPIGRPMFNTKVYIIDKYMKNVPVGVPGEIFIESVGMARGYFNSPNSTAEKFIPNPFSTKKGSRIYKTGDLGKYLRDGNILFLGRSDSQVKLRGFRIELGEIETTLNEYNGIKESIVIIREDEPNEKRLVAYFLSDKAKKLDISDVKEFLSIKLPNYMIPSFYIELESFPRLPNKKINYKAFPKPEFNRDDISSEFVIASNDVEKILSEIWKEILKVEKIGINDNFFELGGDSIIGIQVISKANQAGIKISPKDLFQFPTIKGLASVAESTKEIVAEQEILSGEVNLTPIQKWFFLQNFKNINHWNQSILLEVNDSLDPDILEKTIAKLMEHHDALRMRFTKINDGWNQNYSSIENNIPFENIDLTQFDIEDKRIEIEKWSKEFQGSLNIEAGPIFKCAYFKYGNNESNRLLIVAHHLIIDGVSWRILTEDIQNIYGQLQMRNEVSLPAKTTSLKYWSKRLNDLLEDKEFIEQNSYWNDISTDQKLNNAKLNSSTSNTEDSVKTHSVSLDEKLTETLVKEVPKKFHTEINDVLLTALALTNSVINGKRKMNVSLEGHGREDLFDDIDISRTIGWFTTLYPVVLDLDNSTTRVESLKGIKEQLRKITNNGIGYGILRHLLSENIKNSDVSHLPEISFNYLGQFNQSNDEKAIFKVAKENKGYERALENKRPFQIDISGSITNGKLSLIWMYNGNKYSQEEIQKFSETYIQELTKIIVETISESGGYTPSDFDDVDLDDQDLDSIFSELNEEFDDE